MKKWIGVLLVSVLLAGCGNTTGSDSSNTLQKVALLGKVKEVQTAWTDSRGDDVVKIDNYSKEGKLVSIKLSKNGEVTRIQEFDDKERSLKVEYNGSITEYKYNESAKEVEVLKENKVVSKGKLDDKGQVIEIGPSDDKKVKQVYDDKGNMVELIASSSLKFIYKFNEKGQEIGQTTIDRGKEKIRNYTLDSSGWLLKESDETGTVFVEYSYDEKDDKGNWIKRTENRKTSKEALVETRKITYYE